MIKENKFFFFGFGQTAKYFIKELIHSKIKFKFCATNTKKTNISYFKKRKFTSFKFQDDKFDVNLLKKLSEANFILVSIPPKKKKDLVLQNFKDHLKKIKFKKIIYLSATSVYGNHNGKWVNENSKLKGRTIFGLQRKIVEKEWFKIGKEHNLDINILRVSGIYSKENNVLKKIQKKPIFVKEKKYFSRIRVEDLALIVKKLFFSSSRSLILNASDDEPASNIDVAIYAAKLLKINSIQPVSITSFKNKFIKEFYKDSKKVSNKRMKNKLKIRLKYPTYKQGLKNIINNFT